MLTLLEVQMVLGPASAYLIDIMEMQGAENLAAIKFVITHIVVLVKLLTFFQCTTFVRNIHCNDGCRSPNSGDRRCCCVRSWRHNWLDGIRVSACVRLLDPLVHLLINSYLCPSDHETFGVRHLKYAACCGGWCSMATT